MANEKVNATIDMEDDAVIVPVGVVGVAAGGGLGGAFGTEDLMAEADPTDENRALAPDDDLEQAEEEAAAPVSSERAKR